VFTTTLTPRSEPGSRSIGRQASERGDIQLEHASIAAQRGGHRAQRHFDIQRILGVGDLWVKECIITYDGVPTCFVSVMEITDDAVIDETQYFADPFPAPPGRGDLAEPIGSGAL
jgi:hypothetical protein